ncbi:hypothetical protein ABZW47_16550 [Streptomyces sp. NPDC004549]|uniref:hypothetical protein n=1 Tax=Streptomyces sp. NPDC004549 TaxID=3154283 RepID=UPI0033AC6C8B
MRPTIRRRTESERAARRDALCLGTNGVPDPAPVTASPAPLTARVTKKASAT